MTDTIKTSLNTYVRHDGYIMNWVRSTELGQGHQVTMMDDFRNSIDFKWRSASEPVAGQRVSVLMVKDGVSVHPDHPVMILNHDTGETIREQNAPSPRGTRPIMLSLSFWVLIILSLSSFAIAHTTGVEQMALVLLGTAVVVWRLAYATSELRYDERSQKRIQEEDKVCMETIAQAWQLAATQVFNMKRLEKE